MMLGRRSGREVVRSCRPKRAGWVERAWWGERMVAKVLIVMGRGAESVRVRVRRGPVLWVESWIGDGEMEKERLRCGEDMLCRL